MKYLSILWLCLLLVPFVVVAETTWKVGDKVSASDFRGTWHDAEIKSVEGGNKYKVHYSGWEDKWDEVLGTDRIKSRQTAATAPVAAAAQEILVEFNGQWYPGSVVETGDSYGTKTYKIKYQSSGGEEWVAPNRVVFDKNASKPTVGVQGATGTSIAGGASVSIEYNGGWYPGKVVESGNLFGTQVFKITYTQSGLQEWVAPNRVKAAG